jgi:hypothetical protein
MPIQWENGLGGSGGYERIYWIQMHGFQAKESKKIRSYPPDPPNPFSHCIGIHHYLRPNFTAFGTILTNINLVAPAQKVGSKLLIRFRLPQFFKTICFQIAQTMLCILVKTARNHNAIPSNHARMP